MLKKLVILGAVTVGATLGSFALAPSAEAILYNVNATLADGAIVTGTFDFNGTIYTSWNLTVSPPPIPNPPANPLYRTYSSSTGNFTNTFTGGNLLLGNGGAAPTSSILSVASPGSDFSGLPNTQGFFLVLAFNPPLDGSQTTVSQGSLGAFQGSYTRGIVVNNSGGELLFAENIIPAGSATPVPIESDALPIIGAAAFMAGGLWFKRRRAQAKANLDFIGVESEK